LQNTTAHFVILINKLCFFRSPELLQWRGVRRRFVTARAISMKLGVRIPLAIRPELCLIFVI
jgi:hypothetical protein